MASSIRRTPRLAPAVRRGELLDAALDVLLRDGFGELTVEAVARQAGVTRPVVYDLFGDLDGLLLALVDREEQRALAPLLEIVGGDPGPGADPDAFLADSVLGFLRAVQAAPRTWRLVLMPPGGGSPELRERLRRSRRLIAERVAALLDWGVTRRGGPHGLDHPLLARLIVAAAEDAARLLLARPRRFPPERLAAPARDGLLLLPREPRRPLAPPPALERPSGRIGDAPGRSIAPAAPEPGRRMPQAERREQLLDVALTLLADGGFGALSMEAIARAAGVNRVVVYRSFANLGVLQAALLRREDRRLRETLERLLPDDAAAGSPARALATALARFLDAVTAEPRTWRVALMRPEDAPPALRRIVNARRAALARGLQPLVERALAHAGAPAGQLDVEVLTRMLLSAAEEQGRLALDDPEFAPQRLLAGSWALLGALD